MNTSFDSFNSFNSFNQFNQFNLQHQNMNTSTNPQCQTPQYQTPQYPYNPPMDPSHYSVPAMDQPYLPLYYDLQPLSHSSMPAYHKQVPAVPTTYHVQYYNPPAASRYPVARPHAYGNTTMGIPSHPQYHPSPAAGFVGSGNHGYQMPAWAESVKPQKTGAEYQVAATTTAPIVASGSGFVNPVLSAPPGLQSPIVRPSPPPPLPQAGYRAFTIDLTLDDDNQDHETPAESGTTVPPFDQQLPNEVTPAPSTAEVAPKPAEPRPKTFRKRTYAWLTPSAPVADMPNAKRSKLSDWDMKVRGLAEGRARNTTALHFLNGPPAATPADVVTPMAWAATVADLTAPGGAAEKLGWEKPAPKKARGKKDGRPATTAAAAKKKAAGEGAKKTGKAPTTRKEELKGKMRSKKDAWKKGKVVKEAVVEREAVEARARAEEEDDSDGLVDLIEAAFDDDVDVNTTTRVVGGAAEARAGIDEDNDSDGMVDLIEATFDDDDDNVNTTTSVGNAVVAEKGVVDDEDDDDSLVDVIEGAFDDVVDANPITSVVDEVVEQKAAQDKEDEEQAAGIDDLFESDEEVDSGELIVDENPLTPGEMRMRGL